MELVLVRNWWSPVLRGAIAILFGIIAFTLPGITLGALVLLFGAYALVDGVLSLFGLIRHPGTEKHWGPLLFEGIVGVLAGLVTFFWPAITALALVYIIAAWALVTGVFEIAAAIRLRRHLEGEWLLAFGGIVSVILGVLMILSPAAGALAIAVVLG